MPAFLDSVPGCRVVTSLAMLLAVGAVFAPSLRAQYPVAPTPVINMGSLTREPKFSGYVSLRETVRSDTGAFTIHRARLGVQALPAPFAAVRLQADFAALGRTTGASGDTIPAIQITDAFIQLGVPDTASRMAQLLNPAMLVGQFRTPFSLEALTSSSILLTASRSLAYERMSTKRDRGVMVQLRFPRFAMLSAAVVDGEGANRTSNPDARQMVISRVSVLPVPTVSISGKWAGQGSDHRWGYDARWAQGPVVVEGELIQRTHRPTAPTATEVRGGYALAAYRVLPWLQTVVKWEQLHGRASLVEPGTDTRFTHTTYGLNFLAPQDRVRMQLNWIDRSERPASRKGELVAQFQAIF